MTTTKKGKIIVGISGGVDSAVACYLLQQQGYDVEALFMKNWDEDDGTEYCTAMRDLTDAQRVCNILDIKLHTVNFASHYWDNVFQYFLEEYRANRTPNPDIMCNREIKFKVFAEYAMKLGADKIATGHYAQIINTYGLNRLYKALDFSKDQSYFLHAIEEGVLDITLFPLGHLLKSEVRKIALQQGFPNYDKKDSTGICFIGERRFKDFLKQYIPVQPGPIAKPNGEIIGEHEGLMFYTLGQRKGIGIGGVKHAQDQPWYVVEKNVTQNTLYVAQGGNHPLLFHKTAIVDSFFWLNEDWSVPPQCHAKIRYRQPDQACTITATKKHFIIEFDEPQRAITEGQSLVLYEGSCCLGGGVITAYH